MSAAIIGTAAKQTGIYIVDKYDKDLEAYYASYGPVEGPVRFYRENLPYETIQSQRNKMISGGQASGVAYLMFRALASTGFLGGTPRDVARGTASGVTRHWDNPLNNSTAAIGVGDSVTAETNGNSTDLIAVTNVAYVGTAATDPSYTLGTNSATPATLSVQVAFTGGLANYAWQELICGNFSTGTAFSATAKLPTGTETIGGLTVLTYALLSRVVTPLGTKASGTTWTVTYQLQIS